MIKLGTQSVKIPYAKAYVGDDLVYTTDVGDALLTENGRPITTELGEYLDYESVPYTMLDWIESTGTQWIDTGILNSSTIKVETKMSAQGIGCMNGSEYTWDGQRFKWGTSGTGVLYYGYGSGSHSLSTTPTLDMAYTFYMSYYNDLKVLKALIVFRKKFEKIKRKAKSKKEFFYCVCSTLIFF